MMFSASPLLAIEDALAALSSFRISANLGVDTSRTIHNVALEHLPLFRGTCPWNPASMFGFEARFRRLSVSSLRGFLQAGRDCSCSPCCGRNALGINPLYLLHSALAIQKQGLAVGFLSIHIAKFCCVLLSSCRHLSILQL